MKRYSTTRRKLDKSGVQVYGTTYYPQIPISDSDKFVRPVDGDRLDTLAYRYYGDITLWWVIAKANGIKGKVVTSVDEVLRIPGDISRIIENFRKINKTG
jgi:nucleoid-associated protein YgaU